MTSPLPRYVWTTRFMALRAEIRSIAEAGGWIERDYRRSRQTGLDRPTPAHRKQSTPRAPLAYQQNLGNQTRASRCCASHTIFSAVLAVSLESVVTDDGGEMYRAVLVACARWEEDSIVEWLEYHRALGFEHVYLYSNDDSPETLYRRVLPYVLAESPFVTYLHWPRVGQQIPMYLDFLRRFPNVSEWASFLDIDEFFVLKKHSEASRV